MQNTDVHEPDDPEQAGGDGNDFDDLLWQQLKTLPAFRALLRSVESRFFREIDLPEPVLDLGCGDGHFASITFDKALSIGLDPWWGPLQKAKSSGAYQHVVQSLGDRLPFPNDFFATVISNSVLEHIPNIQPVIVDISRVLRPGGNLVVTMPNHYFTKYLGGALLLEKLWLPNTANAYRRFFNGIARHAHTDPPDVWSERFNTAGLVVERWQYYFSKEALHALEIGHVQGLPSAFFHFLTGHWIVAPWKSSLRYTEGWLRPYYDETLPQKGTMTLFIVRKS